MKDLIAKNIDNELISCNECESGLVLSMIDDWGDLKLYVSIQTVEEGSSVTLTKSDTLSIFAECWICHECDVFHKITRRLKKEIKA